ncbi:MAG: hypothetical protein ACE5I1_30485 [bacterium]
MKAFSPCILLYSVTRCEKFTCRLRGVSQEMPVLAERAMLRRVSMVR